MKETEKVLKKKSTPPWNWKPLAKAYSGSLQVGIAVKGSLPLLPIQENMTASNWI